MSDKREIAKSKDVEDIFRLIDLAEGIKEKIDKSDDIISKIRFIQVFLFVTPFAFAIFSEMLSSSNLIKYAYLIGVFCIIYIAFAQNAVSKIKKRIEPDIYALNSIVSLIRELENITTVNGQWSVIERAEFKIRISRFEIMLDL